MLPDRDLASETAFVTRWADSDDTEALLEVIDLAMAERRPHLAARLVGLLEGRIDVVPGSPAERAQRAARFLVHSAAEERGAWNVADGAFEDLEAAWYEVRRGRMSRMRERQRDALSGRMTRIPRVGRRRDKRR